MNWDELADSADRRKRIHFCQQHGVMLASDENDLTFVIYCLFSCPLLKEEILLWMARLEFLMFVPPRIYGVVLHFVGKVPRFMQWSLEMLHLQQQEGFHGRGKRWWCLLSASPWIPGMSPRLSSNCLTSIKSPNICSEIAWERRKHLK